MKKTENKAIALAAHNIHKEFVLPQHKHNSVKQAFVNIVSRNGKTIQKVLDGVDFEVYKGDFFGIVGRNGSGKSTLLKILAGVYTPTEGEVAVHGGLTPFIELGVGFNPELSGRDNVFLNGALLGFSRGEMEAMYDDIVNFAELAPFMDQKLKNYSSGMQVRLAFSIAIKAHSDVLIFDEVLAVGDEAFQRKCLDVFERYKAEGQTVILVTHDMATVKSFCNRAILVDKGKILVEGDPYDVANKYSELNEAEIIGETARHNDRNATGNLEVKLHGATADIPLRLGVGDTLSVTVKWRGERSIASFGINIFKASGEHITGINNVDQGHPAVNGVVSLDFTLDVTAGSYKVLIEAFDKDKNVVEALTNGPIFNVFASDKLRWSGLIDLPHQWH